MSLEGGKECFLYGGVLWVLVVWGCSRSIVNVCMALKMSIVNLCCVKVMGGLIQWL